MVKIYLKQQINMISLLFSLIIIFYIINQYYDMQIHHYNEYSTNDIMNILECETYEEFIKVAENKKQILNEIENFEGYLGNGIKISENGEKLVNREAFNWYINNIKEKSTITNSIFYDVILMDSILTEYEYQNDIRNRIEAKIMKYNRYIDKYGKDIRKEYMYSKIIGYLNNICLDFQNARTEGLSYGLKQFENIAVTLCMVMICSSLFFCSFVHSGLAKQMLSTQIDIRKNVYLTYLASCLFSAIIAIEIFAVSLFIWRKNIFDEAILSMPIQAIKGYSDVTYPFSVGNYIAFLLIFNVFYAMFANGIFQFISWGTKNVIISVATSIVFGWELVSIYHTIIKWIIEDNVYVILGRLCLEKIDVVGCVGLGISSIILIILIFYTKKRIKGISVL